MRLAGVFCTLGLGAVGTASVLGADMGPSAPQRPSAIASVEPSGRSAKVLEAALARPIIGSTIPLAEVQRFCEARVPRMKTYKTLQEWQADAERIRTELFERVVFRGKAAQWRQSPCRVEWLGQIEGGPGYRIKTLRYEALPGMWIPALLYEPEKLEGKVPAILNVNGHVGPVGKAYVPKQIRCINQAKRGMLALNVEWLGMGQLSGGGFVHSRMNQLDLCGTSGLAPFYLAMSRAIDLLLKLEHTDPERIAVTGLSGGGWQTIYISSLDTRVKLANPVAGYSSFLTRIYHFKDLGDSEQTPCDMATVADYTHLTALMAPRPLLLTYNSKDDCCFESGYALEPLVQAAKPIYELFGKPERLRSHVNHDPGTHNYELDNRQAFYRMLKDFFYAEDAQFDPKEIPSDKEVKKPEELQVPLPPKNEDFNTLALGLAKELPRQPDLPKEKAAALDWQTKRRPVLRQIVRMKDYPVQALQDAAEEKEGLKITYWKLQMGADWTVPAVELVQGQPKQTAILVSEKGRKALVEEAAQLLKDGYRVLALDPFYFGESQTPSHQYLFALLTACVGERPLGLQASQVAAAARWAVEKFQTGPVHVAAIGPRSSTVALVAAALEEKAIGSVELNDALGSLKEVLEKNWSVEQAPEMFCFGLLEEFDIRQLAALVAPRLVRFRQPSDRAKMELADLTDWYRLLDAQCNPLTQ
ncbi:MAG: acetylxylan esterase [Thermoguttaceae bacterium]|nr:acetylxylan esterase [Thermoguttaceae bacterium]